MSFGTLELIVEINQSKANSTAKTVANSMASVIQDALKNSTKGVFDPLITSSNVSTKIVKDNLSSILTLTESVKRSFANTFTTQTVKVNLEIKDLEDKLKSIQARKKELESATVMNVQVDLNKALAALDKLKLKNTLEINIDTSKAIQSVAKLESSLASIAKREDITLKVNVSDALAEIQKLNKALGSVVAKEDKKVTIDITSAKANVERLIAELDKIKQHDKHVLTLDSAKVVSSIENIRKSLTELVETRQIKITVDISKFVSESSKIKIFLDSLEKIKDIRLEANITKVLTSIQMLESLLEKVTKVHSIPLSLDLENFKVGIAAIKTEFKNLSASQSIKPQIDVTQAIKALESLKKALAIKNDDITLNLDIAKVIKAVDNVKTKIDTLSKKEIITLTVESIKALEAIRIFQTEIGNIKKDHKVVIGVDLTSALTSLDKLKASINKINEVSAGQVKINIDTAQSQVEALRKSIIAIGTIGKINLSFDTEKVTLALSNVKKELQSIEAKYTSKLAIETRESYDAIQSIKKLIDSVSKADLGTVRIDTKAAQKSVEELSRYLYSVVNVEPLHLKLDTDRAIKAVGMTKEEIRRLADHEKIQLNFEANQALKQLDLIKTELNNVAKSKEIEIKVNADVVKKQLDIVKAEIDAATRIREVEIKVNAEKTFKIMDMVGKGLSRLVDHGEVQLKLSNDKAIAKIEATSEKIKAAAKVEAVQIQVDGKAAESELKRLESMRQELAKEAKIKIEVEAKEAQKDIQILMKIKEDIYKHDQLKIDFDIRDAENKLNSLSQQIKDTENLVQHLASLKTEANIKVTKSDGSDSKELEKDLELIKEIQRHTNELSKLQKLNLDKQDLIEAKAILLEIHTISNEAIKIKFDKAELDREIQEIAENKSRISKEIEVEIKLLDNEALLKARLLADAIKEVDKDSKIRIDLQTKEAETKLKAFNQQILDTKAILETLKTSSLQTGIKVAKANGDDATSLEKDLELLKEVQRYKNEIIKVDKLNLDNQDLIEAKAMLLELHQESSGAIQLKFDKAALEREAKQIEDTKNRLKKDIEVEIKLLDTEALAKAKLLDDAIKEVDKESKIRIDLQIKDAETKLQAFNQQIKDTKTTLDNLKASSLETNIKVAKAGGNDVTGLEKDLELFKEIQRYKNELSKVEKLNLDTQDLIDAKIILLDIHNRSNDAITIRFDKTALDREAKEIEDNKIKLSKDIEVEIKLVNDEALLNANLLKDAIKEVDKDAKIRIDLQIKDAEYKLQAFNRQLQDTKSTLANLKLSSLETDIKVGKAGGEDVTGLEKNLELLKEAQRYKNELSKVEKLSLDPSDLIEAKAVLLAIHDRSNDAITIKFNKAELDREIKEVEDAKNKLSKDIEVQIKLLDDEALLNANLLKEAVKDVDKAAKIRLDLQVKDAESKLQAFNKQLQDTKSTLDNLKLSSLETDIKVGKSSGEDVSELERQLELLKEVRRYKNELSQVGKLSLDSSDLIEAQAVLLAIHNRSNDAIMIKFDSSQIEKEAKQIEETKNRISKEIEVEIKLLDNDVLEKARLLDEAIKQVDKESQIRIDLQTTEAENKIKAFKQQIEDTKSTLESLQTSRLETDIKVGKANNDDVSELEKQLEIVKEIKRYKNELSQVDKLNLDTQYLVEAKELLLDIHNQTNDAITIRFNNARLQSDLNVAQKMIADTQSMADKLAVQKIQGNIETNRSAGLDTTELDTNLALLKETIRHKNELGNLSKLSIDGTELVKVKGDLIDLHDQSMKDILIAVETKKSNAEIRELQKLIDDLQKRIQIQVNLEAKQATSDAKDLQGIRDAIAKDTQIRITADITQAEDDFKRLSQQLKDMRETNHTIKVKKLEADVDSGKVRNVDTSGIEKELALVKELQRYKAELERVSKLNLDSSDLDRAKKELHEIHKISNDTIELKFSESGLDKIRSEFKSTLSGMKSGFSGISQGILQGMGQNIFQGFTDGVRGLVSGLGGAIGTFSGFTDSLNQFRTFSGGTKEDMEAVGNEAKRLGRETSTTATDVAKASIEMVKLGFSASETKNQLAGVVSLAESTGMTDMGKAAEIAGAAYTVFGISAEKTADLVSVMANKSAAKPEDMLQVLAKTGGIAKATGQSIEQMSVAFAFMRKSGFTAESAATGLKTALLRLAAPSNEARDALKTLGVEAYDANGKMKPILDLVPEMRTALSGFDDPSKMDITSKIFGDRGGPAFLALLGQSQTEIDALLNSATNSKGDAKASAAKLLEGLPGAIKVAKGSIQNLVLDLGGALSPAIEAILRLGIEVANTLGKGDMFATLKEGSLTFASYLKDNAALVKQIVAGIQQLSTAIGTQLNTVAKDFGTYLKANPDAMKTMVQDIVNLSVNLGTLVLMAADFGKGFVEASIGMSSMLEPMISFTNSLTGSKDGSASLAENLGKAAAYVIPLLLLGNLVGTITTIATGISGVVGFFGGWAVLGTTITGIMSGIGATLVSVYATVGGLIAGTLSFAQVWASVIGAINPVGLAIAAVGITIYNIIQYTQNWDDFMLGVNQTIEDTKNVFKDIVKWIVDAIGQSENFENIWKFIKELIIAITSPFGLITKIIDVGVEKTGLFKKEWEFIKGLATSVGNAFKSVVGGALEFLIQKAGQLANTLKSMMGMGGSSGGQLSAGDASVASSVKLTAAISKQSGITNEFAQAALAGTIQQESNFDPDAKEGGGTQNGRGLVQWDVRDRAKGIVKMDANGTPQGNQYHEQLKLGIEEMVRDYKAATGRDFKSDLNGAKSVREAMSIFQKTIRFGDSGDRDNHAENALKILNSNQGIAPKESGGYGNGASGVSSFANSFPGSSEGSEGGKRLANQAKTMVGKAFAPGLEAQCANFVRAMLSQAGMSLATTQKAWDGYEDNPGEALAASFFGDDVGQRITDKKNVQAGDLVAFGGTYGGYSSDTITHVGIGTGNGMMVDRSTSQKDVTERSLDTFDGTNGGQGKFLYAVRPKQFGGSSLGNSNNSGGSNSEVLDAQGEISGLRSTVKEQELERAEKEAKKLADAQEKVDRKNQKAIESAAKMQDQGLSQKRKTEKETRQLDKDERIEKIDRQLATTTNSDAKSALENTKKKLAVGSTESEKIIEGEQKIEDLKKGRERKGKDLKSPLEDVREKAKQMPDFSQAIKDEEKILTGRRKIRNEMEITASLEFDTANKTKNEDLEKVSRIQIVTESYNKEKRMLEELKAVQEEEDPTAVKKTEMVIRRLDLQQASTLALIEEEAKLKKATEARDDYNKALAATGAKPDDTLKRLSTEVDNIANKVKDINADKNTKLKIIDVQEIKNAKELAKALQEVEASKRATETSSKTNLARAKANVLRKSGDEFGANALERDAAKKDQVIKNEANDTKVEKDISDAQKAGSPFSVEKIKELRSESKELGKIDLSQAGSQFKTLGETIGTTFRDSVGSALKDVLTGAKSMGEAFQDVVSNMLSKLAELAVNSLLKDLMGGMFTGGGGGGGGGIFGNLLGGLFGGGNSEGGMVPNFSDGNLSTIGGNRPYLAGEPFRAARNSPIAKALQREGSGGVVSVLKANELVLNPSQTKTFFAMGMDQQLSGAVSNYAEGNMGSFSSNYSGESSNGSNTVTVPITVNMSDSSDKGSLNIPKLQDEVRKTVIAEIQFQQRNGNALSRN